MCEAAFSKEQESMREFAETIRCDLKCVASEALARSGLDDSCTPASFRTGSVWPKSYINSQNQIGSGLVLHCMIRAVCGSTRPSVKVEKLVAGFVEFCQNRARWFLHTGLLLDQIRMAKTWPDHPDWIWAGFEKNINRTFFGRAEPNRMQEVGSRHTRPGPILPACWTFWFRIGSGMFTGRLPTTWAMNGIIGVFWLNEFWTQPLFICLDH